MRLILLLVCFIILVAFIVPARYTSEKPYPSIEQAFKLIWKAKTGIATFRSNVLFDQNDLIIGSNGSQLMDYNFIDTASGVYIVDRHNGKIKRHFGEEVMGDMDVNGVMQYNNQFYFGNDNEEFLCTTPKGEIVWRNPASGDIEHEPVLLDIRGKTYIVYATEEGEVQAVDPSSGVSFWTYYTPDFNGWKPGKNRNLFKVRAYFRNSSSFFTKPVMLDLNKDGIKDLVYNTYDSKIYAINGLNGKLLWDYDHDGQLSVFSVVDDQNAEPALLMAGSKWRDYDKYDYKLLRLDRNGKMKTLFAGSFGNGFGLNALKVSHDQLLIPCTDSLAIFSLKTNQIEWIDRSLTYLFQYTYPNSEKFERVESRNARDPLIAQQFINYNGDSSCVVLISQYDRANYQLGVLEIISLKEKKLHKRFSLPASSEMVPIITDVNQDGRKEILVNCSDGFTYCYQIPL